MREGDLYDGEVKIMDWTVGSPGVKLRGANAERL